MFIEFFVQPQNCKHMVKDVHSILESNGSLFNIVVDKNHLKVNVMNSHIIICSILIMEVALCTCVRYKV